MCRFLRGGGSKGLAIDVVLIIGLFCLIFYFFKTQQVTHFSNLPVNSANGTHLPREGSQGGQQATSGGSGGRGQQGQTRTNNTQNIIEARIKLIGDVRSEKCKSEKYDLKESVSIVIDFNDYQFYNLKTTMSSILHVITDRVAEVIIVDDGSTLKYIIDDCEAYVKSLRGVRVVRHKTQMGQLKARMTGYNEAKSGIVVFMDVNVIVSRGWLEPLIDLLVTYPNILAVPHYDHILDPVTMDYRHTHINLVASWSWNLAIKMRYTPDKRVLSDSRFVSSPAILGNAFAVRKTFFDRIGALDEGMENEGGEYLDLSLKTWFCEGSIMIATCSRVGVLNLFSPVKVRSRPNIRHLIHTYFGSHVQAALRLNGLTSGPSTTARRSGGKAAPDLSKCKGMDWYLKNIRNETASPSADVVQFGILRVHSGRCARINVTDTKVDLHPCSDTESKEEPIELTTAGRMRLQDGRCISTTGSAFMVAEPCQANETKQSWTYKENFELVNTWSGFCARHVTDPDKKSTWSRQIAMAQACTGEPKSTDIFKQWSFLPV